MKNYLLASLAAVVLTSSTFAFTPSQSERIHATKLVPTKVVTPANLPRTFIRDTVHIEFSIDAAGRPCDIKVLSNADKAVKDQVIAAFSQWRFEASETVDTAKRFVLPLEIVPGA